MWHEVGVFGLEMEKAPHLLGTHHVYSLSECHFVADIPEKAVMARDNDFGRPKAGCDPEELKLDGKKCRIFSCAVDIAVNASDKRCDDLFSIRVIMIHLLPHVHTGLKEPGSDIFIESFASEDLCEGSCGLSSPDLELEQSVSGYVKSLCKKEVLLILCIDVRDSPSVLYDLDRLRQTFDAKGFFLELSRLIK
jgi:hypothetical protein